MDEHPYDETRPEMLAYIPSSAMRILDVGCSRGGLIGALKERFPAPIVWGIEPSSTAAEAARQHADHVVHGAFPSDLDPSVEGFDAIIFNDVLEHVVDPWEMLRCARQHLRRNGTIVASIPNARYWSVLTGLVIRGDFTYTETGSLDRTHLRFFTRSTMLRLFEDTGYIVERCDPINLRPGWKPRLVSALMPNFGQEVRALQYAIVAHPAS